GARVAETASAQPHGHRPRLPSARPYLEGRTPRRVGRRLRALAADLTSMHRDVIEPIVGALVLLIAGAFAWFAYTTTGIGGAHGYEIVASFDRVGSLGTGSDVRVSGVKVGTVTALALDPKTFLANVRFSVARAVEIPDDSVAQITS